MATTATQPKTASFTGRPTTLAAVQAIMNKRKQQGYLTEADKGRKVIVSVRGNGNVIDVVNKDGELVMQAGTDGVVLTKKIFNVVATSAIAVANKRNLDILRAGYAAEQAGDEDKAAEHYNDYLNKTQVSISILAGHKLWKTLQDGEDVQGIVQLIETPNGQILTLDPSTLSIKEAIRTGNDNKVDLMSFMLPDVNSQAAAETAPSEEVHETA